MTFETPPANKKEAIEYNSGVSLTSFEHPASETFKEGLDFSHSALRDLDDKPLPPARLAYDPETPETVFVGVPIGQAEIADEFAELLETWAVTSDTFIGYGPNAGKLGFMYADPRELANTLEKNNLLRDDVLLFIPREL